MIPKVTMCPDENALVAMIEQALDPAAASALEVHFDTCERCCAMIAALAGTRPVALGTPGARWVRGALGLDDDVPPPEWIGAEGRYQVRDLLGRGGMGAVYLARDASLDRDVALKLHRAGSGEDRLEREAQAMAKLAHPNVVTVFEIGSVDDRLFVAMEYVRGGTLRTWLAKPRTWREILALLGEVGSGLVAAHAAGLIHRDFKPENVLVGEDGRPRVGDFGLARVAGAPTTVRPSRRGLAAIAPRGTTPPAAATALGTPAPGGSHLHVAVGTATGAVVGTPAYMAPEQFAGERLDARCDQFAFCVVAWECLFGARPFAGATAEAIQLAIENRELAQARGDVPDRVKRVLERGLAAAPRDRYPDVASLLADLRAAAAPRTRKRLVIGAAAALVAVGVAIPVAYLVRDQRREVACEVEANEVRALYDVERRAAVQRGFAGTESPFAQAAFERATQVLEQYVAILANETSTTCRGREEPAPVTEARRACLAERNSQLAALVEVLAQPDLQLVMRAPSAAWAIFDPKPCHEPRVVAPSAREHVAAIGKLRGLGDAGRYAEAVTAGTALVDAAKRTGDRATELEALIQIGEAHASLDAVPEAVATLHRAQALAETLGRDLEAAIALDRLANIAGLTQHDYAAAHRHIDLARAKLERLGDGNLVARGRLLATEAQVLMDEYRIAEAEPVITRAVLLLEQAYGIDTPELGSALGIASQITRGVGKREHGLALSERAVRILDATLGSFHPTVAGAHLNLAQSLLQVGRFEEARDKLRAADAVFARVFGDDHPVRAAVAGNLGEAEQQLGNHDAAIAAFRRAVDVLSRTEGAQSASTAAARRDLARTMATAGRTDDALRELATAIALLESLGPDGVGRLRGALVDRAQYELVRGHDAIAVTSAEHALAIATKHPETTLPNELAETRFVLARALAKQDRERARAIAREALATAEGEQRTEIQAWLEP